MTSQFAPNSRYFSVTERSLEDASGQSVPFLARRILPARERFTALDRIRLAGGERLDAIAADAFGDPALFWRICDADGAQDPVEATAREGKLLIVPLPLEISDDGNA